MMKMTSSIPGCVFEYFGRVPRDVFQAETFESPLEEAVHQNDVSQLKDHIQEGHSVSVKLKIGQMSCIEFAAMKGYTDILRTLLEHSSNADTLNKYYAYDDVVDRAYMISKNKKEFFEDGALAEANRYEAALFTAVEYNQPECVALMLSFMGHRDPPAHMFTLERRMSNDEASNNGRLDKLNALGLARVRGHQECLDILSQQYN